MHCSSSSDNWIYGLALSTRIVVYYTLSLTVVYDIFQMTAHESNSASSLVWMDLIISMQAILM